MKQYYAEYYDDNGKLDHNDTGSLEYLVSIAHGRLMKITAVAILLLSSMTASQGSSACLTKSEARELWPRQHIYWYSSDHCWSNRRGPPSGIKTDLIREDHAEEVVPNKTDQHDRAEPEHNNKPGSQGGRAVRVIPITKWQNDFEDYCCWPPMDEVVDIDREREHAFQLLAEKMKRQ